MREKCSKTPEGLLTGVKLPVEHLKTSGCEVWVRIPDKMKTSECERKISGNIAMPIV